MSTNIDLMKLALCIQNKDLRYQILEHIAENLEVKADLIRTALRVNSIEELQDLAVNLGEHSVNIHEAIAGISADNISIVDLHDTLQAGFIEGEWSAEDAIYPTTPLEEFEEEEEDDDPN